MAKIAINAARLPKFEPVIVVAEKDHGKRFCACAESCVVFNTGPYTVLPDNSIFTARAMLALQALY